MKRYFLLPLVILSFVFTACSGDDSSSNDFHREYSKTYKGVYLDTIDGEKRLCYSDCDTENLRKYSKELSIDEEFNLFYEKYAPSGFAMFGVSDSMTAARKLEYYDLFAYNWNCYRIEKKNFDDITKLGNNDVFLGVDYYNLFFTFNEDGSVITSYIFRKEVGKVLNSYGFTIFKLYSSEEKLYLKFMFFDTINESSLYGTPNEHSLSGNNYEYLTINDITLTSEITFQYVPMENLFALLTLE